MISWLTRKRLLRVLLAGLALATAGSFFGGLVWWLDLLADFRLHLALSGMVLFAAAQALRQRMDAGLALALVMLNAAILAPHISFPPEEMVRERAIKIVSFNVNNHNPDIASTLDFLRRENADIVVLTEVTDTLRDALKQLSDIYPHRFFSPLYVNPGHNPHRIGMLSKRAWADKGIEWSDVSSRAFAVWVRFPAASPGLTVTGVHLLNNVLVPVNKQEAEVRGLVSLINRFDGPVVVAGDFNMTPFSARFGNLLRKTVLSRAGGGLNATWPSQLTPLGLPIDHILVKGGVGSAVMRTGPRLGSDHLPLVGTFSLNR